MSSYELNFTEIPQTDRNLKTGRFIKGRSFGVSNADMKFIIDYLTENWKKKKNELEAEFEQL